MVFPPNWSERVATISRISSQAIECSPCRFLTIIPLSFKDRSIENLRDGKRAISHELIRPNIMWRFYFHWIEARRQICPAASLLASWPNHPPSTPPIIPPSMIAPPSAISPTTGTTSVGAAHVPAHAAPVAAPAHIPLVPNASPPIAPAISSVAIRAFSFGGAFSMTTAIATISITMPAGPALRPTNAIRLTTERDLPTLNRTASILPFFRSNPSRVGRFFDAFSASE